MYYVTLINSDVKFYLRGTTWTSDKARAFAYVSMEECNKAIELAKPFMKKALVKRIIITGV